MATGSWPTIVDVANRMDPQFYDKNYKGELPKGV